jgi:hypothetical protein
MDIPSTDQLPTSAEEGVPTKDKNPHLESIGAAEQMAAGQLHVDPRAYRYTINLFRTAVRVAFDH